MKFTIPAPALADAASFAAKGINPRPANPILSGLLIEAAAGMLRMSGFDYDKSARTQVAADVEADGNVLLPGKMFVDIIRKFGKKTVTVEVEGPAATLTAGSAEFRVSTMPAADFPTMPALPQSSGTIDGDVLADAIGQIIGAASTDATVAALTGVKIMSDGSNLVLLATDKYRLAEVVIPWSPTGSDIEALVRGSWLADMGKNLAGETQVLSDGAVFGLRTGNRATTTLEMADDYPKIRGLFPDSTLNHLTVDRAELADVISRVSLVAETNEAIRISASDDLLTVEAGRGEGATGRETIPCELSGEDIEVQFSPLYLGWSLAVTPSERVTLGFQQQMNRPALIEGHDGLKHLVMPRLAK